MILFKFLFRNAFRNKIRIFLTILGIAVAILAFGLLRTVVDAWYAGVTASSANRLVTRNAISLVFHLPISYKEKIQQVEGVSIVSYGNWFGGIYIEEKNFFANFAVEPVTYLKLYPELIVSPEHYQLFVRNRKGALAGRKLMERFGWKIGDIITLKGTIFPANMDFIISGIYKGRDKSTDESMFLFHWDYLNETVKKTIPSRADHVGFFIVGIENPAIASQVSTSIDQIFKNSLAETLTETEKAFQLSFIAMTEAIILAIQLISFVIIVIIMAVVANTMAMTVRERFGEYAVLKALGFRGYHIVGMIFGESLVITTIGCIIGVFATFPASDIFTAKLGAYFPVFNITSQTIYMDIGASILVGVISAILPSYRAVRIRIADGLRRLR